MLLELVIVLVATAAFCGWTYRYVNRPPAPPRSRPTAGNRRSPDE